MKKITVAALGLAFAFSAVAASAAMTYTRDLTIGSTGADVISLQTTLVSKGFLVIPATVQKGYFGALTKTALSNYQKSVGISPAVGYFGPVTRAHFNAMTDTPAGDDGDDDNGDLQGGEGDIKDFDVLGNPSSTDLDEGQTDEVLGFEFEAEDSDIRVERLDILASATAGIAGDASDEPWDYIESARLMLDGDEVAEVTDLDDEDMWDEEDDDVYSFRFEDIDVVVEEDETAKFYVEFTAADSLDSDDEGTEFDISIADDGLRAVDAEGIDLYEGDEDDEVSVTFEGAEAGDLELSIDSEDNEDRTVFVDEDSETEGVEIMRFTIEANASTNMIDELQVKLATSTATNTTIASVITSLRLEVDGDEISTESIPSGTGTSTVTFEDLEDDFEVADGDEVEVVILADFDEQEGNYGEGFEFYAAVLGAGIEAEDAEGDDVTVSDDVYGGEIEVRVDGIAVELVSASIVQVLAADPATTSADVYSYTIKFEVTAEGDDVFIDKSVQATSTPTIAGGGVAWSTTSQSTTASTQTNAQTLSASGSTSGDNSSVFKISNGSTRTFTLKVTLEATADGSTAVELTGINWTTDSSDTTPDNYYTFALDDFETELQFMNKI
jgi:hypothetical protein